jgi:hypothetical protein
VKVAGQAGVRPEDSTRGAVKGLLEEIRGGDAFGERERPGAQLCLGVEEDGFVCEVLPDAGSVEVTATLEEDAENIAFGKDFENFREAETAVLFGERLDFRSGIAKSFAIFLWCARPGEDEKVVICGAD